MVNGEICIGLFAIRDIKKVRSAADIVAFTTKNS